MKFKTFLVNLMLRVKESVSRFSVAFVCSVLAFCTMSYGIIFEVDNSDIIYQLCMAFAMGGIISIFLKLLVEYFEKFNLKSLWQHILSGVLTVLTFFLVRIYYESVYMAMAYAGILVALLCFIFFVIMRGENKDMCFPKIVSSMIFTSATCGILSAGLSICIAAVQSLIYNGSSIYKVYMIVNLFVWVVVYVNLFLSFVPGKGEEITGSKIFRSFVLFVGLPIYTLLIFILFIYLAKIVVTWHMPVGEINWFASFASLFFIFFLLSVRQYEEKGAKLFVKFGGFLLIPVLIMQSIAVFERINAYGLTTPRTVSLVLIVIGAMFILSSLIAPKHTSKIVLSSGVIVLLVTITPFNVIDMPISSQTKILRTVLTENNMLKDGKVIPNKNLNERDEERIRGAYEYLKYDAKKLPDFVPDTDDGVEVIFGIKEISRNSAIYCNLETKSDVDITGYNRMVKFEYYSEFIELEHKGKTYSINPNDIANKLYKKYGEDSSEVELYKINEDIALYFEWFSFEVRNNEATDSSLEGYFLLKD